MAKTYWRQGGRGGWDVRVTKKGGMGTGRLRWDDLQFKNYMKNISYEMPKVLGQKIRELSDHVLATVKGEGEMMGRQSNNISYLDIAESLDIMPIGKNNGLNDIQGARIYPAPFRGDKSGPIASRMRGYPITLPSLYNSVKSAWDYGDAFTMYSGGTVVPSATFQPQPRNGRDPNWFRPKDKFPGIGTGRRRLAVYDYIKIFEDELDKELTREIPKIMTKFLSASSTYRRGPGGR
jgi:hypothetical protein